MINTYIAIKTQVEFFHCWPEAPEEVKFLRNLHRHMLHIQCTISVEHQDRELEFIMVKRSIEQYLKTPWVERTSCESVGRSLISHLRVTYGKDRTYKVEVFEDGENGAILIATPEED